MERLIKKPKAEPPIEEFLKSKPIRNPSVGWSKAPSGEIGIRPVSVEKKPKKRKNMLIALDSLGSFVWERCDGTHNVEEIARELSGEYKITDQEAQISLGAFLPQLAAKGLIEIRLLKLGKKAREEEDALRKIRLT
jgi:hypothetical protein